MKWKDNLIYEFINQIISLKWMLKPETLWWLTYKGESFSHYHVSKELYFHEVVLAETLAPTFVVSMLFITVLSITASTTVNPPGNGREMWPFYGQVQVSINYREGVKQLPAVSDLVSSPWWPWWWCWKRPPREYSCPNSWLLSTEPSM